LASRSREEGQVTQPPDVGKAVVAGGIKTNYHEAGTGTPVVLVHGSGPGVSAWSNWRLTIPYLAERLHVYAYDQVGFGYTDLPTRHKYGLEPWRKHLIDFMDAIGLERAHLIGNSMGAAVVLAVAVTRPDLVDRVVVMGATGVRFPLTPALDALWGYTPTVDNMRNLMPFFMDDQALVTEDLVQMRYQASVRPGMQEAFASMFPAPRQAGINDLAAYEDRLDEIRAPVLIIHGREDQIVPPANAQRLFDSIDHAQLHMFGHCGHWTQIEHREAFNHLVRDFLT
jgi:2-hydroxymuconate-semialdehyde hydrolase